MQAQLEPLEAEGKDDETLRAIQQILYSTEVRTPIYVTRSESKRTLQDGFEVPEGGAAADEEETF